MLATDWTIGDNLYSLVQNVMVLILVNIRYCNVVMLVYVLCMRI